MVISYAIIFLIQPHVLYGITLQQIYSLLRDFKLCCFYLSFFWSLS